MSYNLNIEKYKNLLDNALSYYYDKLTFLKFFQKEPKSRYHTFKYVIEYIKNNNLKNVLELEVMLMEDLKDAMKVMINIGNQIIQINGIGVLVYLHAFLQKNLMNILIWIH